MWDLDFCKRGLVLQEGLDCEICWVLSAFYGLGFKQSLTSPLLPDSFCPPAPSLLISRGKSPDFAKKVTSDGMPKKSQAIKERLQAMKSKSHERV